MYKEPDKNAIYQEVMDQMKKENIQKSILDISKALNEIKMEI